MAKRRRMELGQVEDVVPNLPADLSFEIFSRLPAKSLIRCKCVCKSWSSFIRSPSFVTAYRNKLKNLNQHTTNLFFTIPGKQSQFFSTRIYHDKYGILNTTPPIHLPSAPYRVSYPFSSCYLAASSGVVCYCLDFDTAEPHERKKRVEVPVHISNLYTGEVVTFQLPRHLYPKVAVALGFSSLTNVYKVLTSLRTGTTGFKFKVFTLGGTSNTWKDVADIDFEDLGLVPDLLNFSKHYLCIHGAIHWMQRFYCKNRPVLLAFDVVEETFRIIRLPQDSKNKPGPKCGRYRVIEVNGCLAVFNNEFRGSETAIDFWILKDYQNEVWVKEKIMFPAPWWSLGYPRPVCSIHTGEILLNPDQRKHGSVHLYDMELKTYKKSDIVLPEGSVIVARGYEETLSPLN
ncbi:PREDICTED: F-box protein At5g65850 [Fragaria vesca subsp. vesca]|uniref:F-box protein At5g65850 n=1 Tax=Fragaria vesca subsp. vesca TaxID=101020 RepID=UPI0002C33680|nr:PREDICTED: F-box protein At5g65850 [Fragaria vesca subsp. vesca]